MIQNNKHKNIDPPKKKSPYFAPTINVKPVKQVIQGGGGGMTETEGNAIS